MALHRVYTSIAIACILIAVVVVFERLQFTSQVSSRFGVSFNPDHARYLGLNVEETYRTIIEKWGFKYVRLPAQWNTVEPEQNVYSFKELDDLMNESADHGVKVILVVGQKTPRWPECHLPEWAQNLKGEKYQEALRSYMRTVIERYKNNPALETWQVENEPFLGFGACPSFSKQDLYDEIALVRQLDDKHGILITDSGELHFWQTTARAGDLFGSTLYRVVWNKEFGYIHYDWLSPAWYRFKLWLANRSPETAYVIELQAEPWLPDTPIKDVTLEEQNKSMNLVQLQANIDFAKRLGFARIYLWGAEWWYYEQLRGNEEIAAYIEQLEK
jgi:hypothetical protein